MSGRLSTRSGRESSILEPPMEQGLELLVSVSDHGSVGRNPHEALFERLEPVLASIGAVRRVDRPETRLAFAALKAEELGRRPIHIAIGLPHEIFLSPAVATVIVPLWGFPDIPARDLSHNSRQNWSRIVSFADAVVSNSRETQKAFQAVVDPQRSFVLPTPAADEFWTVRHWSPKRVVSLECRHVSWGGPPRPPRKSDKQPAEPSASPASAVPPPKFKVGALRGKAKHLAKRSVKQGYNRYIRRWISDAAHEQLKGLKRTLLGRKSAPPPPPSPVPTLRPSELLEIQGPVFLAEVDFPDPGVNDLDLLSGFLLAFRTRSDVTLVVRLVTTVEREAEDLRLLSDHYESLKIDHGCRLVVVSEPLSNEQSARLMEGVTFVVDTRRAAREARLVCEAFVAGRPVIAPIHSALGEWVEPAVGLPLRSSEEPAAWPQDPRRAMESTVYRLDWADLKSRLVQAAGLDSEAYRALCLAAKCKAEATLAPYVVRSAWQAALEQIPSRSTDALGWDD